MTHDEKMFFAGLCILGIELGLLSYLIVVGWFASLALDFVSGVG